MGLDFQKHISGRGTRTPAHSPVAESVSILPDTFTFHMPCPFSFPNTGTKAGHSLRCIVVHPYQWNHSMLLRWYLPAGAHFPVFHGHLYKIVSGIRAGNGSCPKASPQSDPYSFWSSVLTGEVTFQHTHPVVLVVCMST